MNKGLLIKAAREYAANVPRAKNAFASKPSYLRRSPWEARVVCSTFVTCLLEETQGLGPKDFAERFGRSSPFSADYHEAIVVGEQLDHVPKISGVRAGDLISIKYSEELRASTLNTGHCALVNGAPKLDSAVSRNGQTLLAYAVPIIDATGGNAMHGPDDSRAQDSAQGVGAGTMALLVNTSGFIVGYAWSTTSMAHLSADGERDVLVGSWRLPGI